MCPDQQKQLRVIFFRPQLFEACSPSRCDWCEESETDLDTRSSAAVLAVWLRRLASVSEPVLDRAGEAAGRPEERLQVQIQDRQDASPIRVIPSHVEEPNLYAVEHAGVVVEPDRHPYLPAIDVVIGGYG